MAREGKNTHTHRLQGHWDPFLMERTSGTMQGTSCLGFRMGTLCTSSLICGGGGAKMHTYSKITDAWEPFLMDCTGQVWSIRSRSRVLAALEDRLLGEVQPTNCLIDPCPLWLVRAARGGMAQRLAPVINASLIISGRASICPKGSHH